MLDTLSSKCKQENFISRIVSQRITEKNKNVSIHQSVLEKVK
jgi:hypothetical protein